MTFHIRIWYLFVGGQRFLCEQCDESFTKLGSLLLHKKCVHENLRPFGCQQCGKHFKRADHLKKHIQSHTRAMSENSSNAIDS